MDAKSILMLSFFLLTTPKLIFADEEGHIKGNASPPIEETSSFKDSIYSIGVEEDTESYFIDNPPLDSPFSSINSLDSGISLLDEDIKTIEPMKPFKEKKTSSQKHDQHKKQHVEEALHEWISPNVKGHKVAISITILSGLAFMALSFFRIGEKN